MMDKCGGCPLDKCDDCPVREYCLKIKRDPRKCCLDHEQQENIRKAIAGKGRLWCLPPDVTEVVYGYRQVNIYGQDQGGE